MTRGRTRDITLRSLVLMMGLAVFGCKPSEPGAAGSRLDTAGPGNRPLLVVCTTGMVADLVRHVGGERVEVDQLMGAGVDPHLYKASPGDIRRLSNADVIFYSGLHLEGTLTDRFVQFARRKPTFAVTEALPESRLLTFDEGFADPHVWFDVLLWSETLDHVAARLAEVDPAHAGEYAARAEAYRKELVVLHEEVKSQLAEIPRSQRVLVTAHDAFGYFGRAYDVEVRAIQGISTESEAGVREINELVRFLVDRKIKAVFVETSVSNRNIRALIEGAAQAGQTVKIGGELYSDAMGAPGTPEGTYIGMIRHNVRTITEALK